jgi:hypothetical protein
MKPISLNEIPVTCASSVQEESSLTTDKVKNLIASSSPLFFSDLLMVGCALSISFFGAISILHLMGDPKAGVELLMPCAITAFVLYILAQINSTGSSKSQIGERDTFKHENQHYYVAPTTGDGACGLHAVLGEKPEGSDVYFKENARECFATQLQNVKNEQVVKVKLEKWLVDLSKDYLAPRRSAFSDRVFNDDLVQELKQKLEELEQRKQTFQHDQKLLFDQALENEAVIQKLKQEVEKEQQRTQKTGLLEQLETNRTFRNNKMRENLNHIIQLLKEEEIGTGLSENLRLQTDLDQQRDQIYLDFVRQDVVFEAYIEGIKKNDYWVSTQELELVAHVFGLRVRVFHQYDQREIEVKSEEGPQNGPLVSVFHRGVHFSRLEELVEKTDNVLVSQVDEEEDQENQKGDNPALQGFSADRLPSENFNKREQDVTSIKDGDGEKI